MRGLVARTRDPIGERFLREVNKRAVSRCGDSAFIFVSLLVSSGHHVPSSVKLLREGEGRETRPPNREYPRAEN